MRHTGSSAVGEAAEDRIEIGCGSFVRGSRGAHEVADHRAADRRGVARITLLQLFGHHLLEHHAELRGGDRLRREPSKFERDAQRAARFEAIE